MRSCIEPGLVYPLVPMALLMNRPASRTHAILVLGLGDLGRKISLLLSAAAPYAELWLAGRGEAARQAGALMASIAPDRVSFFELDLTHERAIASLLRHERPDLVVHSASVLSPWYLAEHPTRASAALQRAGFAIQLPAQLSLLLSTMRAARETSPDLRVVNCSYPDATHPMLAAAGLAPTIGIGNVGMVAMKARAQLAREGAAGSTMGVVRALAHHGQIPRAMAGNTPNEERECARVYVGEAAERGDRLAYAGPSVRSGRDLNDLSAVSAVEVITGLLGDRPARLCAPGPLGLPGGYPVALAQGEVRLDLPQGVELAEAVAFNTAMASLDGIEGIHGGVVEFTAQARREVAEVEPRLAEPLTLSDVLPRMHLLLECIR